MSAYVSSTFLYSHSQQMRGRALGPAAMAIAHVPALLTFATSLPDDSDFVGRTLLLRCAVDAEVVVAVGGDAGLQLSDVAATERGSSGQREQTLRLEMKASVGRKVCHDPCCVHRGR